MVENNNKSYLNYKEHGDYFDDYFLIRKRAFALLAESIRDANKIPLLYESVVTLIEYTSNYIHNLAEVDKKLEEIDKIYVKNQNKPKSYELVPKFRDLLRMINDEHEKSDIIPQKSTDYDIMEQFWREEESVAMQQMKKAFYDLFMKNG